MLISTAWLVLAAPLSGEDYPATGVFGSVGWGRWWDDEGAPIGGVHGGGGIGRRLLPQFAVEGEVIAFRGTRGYPGPTSPHRETGQLFTGNGLLYIFRRGHAQVFVLLGAGAAHSTTEVSFGEYHNRSSGTGFIANAGLGVKASLSQHVALRPEVRVIAGTTGSSAIEPFSAGLRLSMGFEYQW
jgi:hypothetical protein